MNRASLHIPQLWFTFLAIAFVGCQNSPQATKQELGPVVHPLPPIGNVRTVVASLRYEVSYTFDLPLDSLPSIFASLEPAYVDQNPAEWIVFGSLQLTLIDGRPFHIELYYLDSDEPGAFSAGETFENRIYYRGGSSVQLLAALRDARKSALVSGTPESTKSP